jgi:hypothetical protein
MEHDQSSKADRIFIGNPLWVLKFRCIPVPKCWQKKYDLNVIFAKVKKVGRLL